LLLVPILFLNFTFVYIYKKKVLGVMNELSLDTRSGNRGLCHYYLETKPWHHMTEKELYRSTMYRKSWDMICQIYSASFLALRYP
jgi:hypothetical protein